MRVVIAEDQLLTREGIARLLKEADVDVVGEAGEVDALMRLVHTQKPDVALVDIRMPPTHTNEGLVAAVRIRGEVPGTGILVLSQHVEADFVIPLLEEGTSSVGYLLKDRIMDPATLLDGLRRVAAGECVVDPAIVRQLVQWQRREDPLAELTDREREVLALIAEGLTNVAIGRRLFISERTVEVHTKQIFTKLGLVDAADGNRRVLAVLAYLDAAT
jgi:DNA-binding NarL/FixJ family response regulator